jgi:hypothetical protein
MDTDAILGITVLSVIVIILCILLWSVLLRPMLSPGYTIIMRD